MRTRPDWWHDKWFHRGCHIVGHGKGKEHYNRLELLTSIVAMVGRWLLVVRLLGYEMLLSNAATERSKQTCKAGCDQHQLKR